MKNTGKKGLCALCALLLCAGMAGCGLVTVNEERDNAQVAAKVGEFNITKGELKQQFQNMVNMYSMYGMTIGETEVEAFRNDIFESLIQQKVLETKAKEMGFFELNEEDKAAMEADIQTEIDGLQTYLQDTVAMEKETDPTVDDAARLEQLYLEQTGTTAEEYARLVRENFESSYPVDKLREHYNAQVNVSEEEIRAEYDTELEADKTTYAETPGTYKADRESYDRLTDATGTIPPLYVPEGYRRVRVIAVYPEGELSVEYTDKITRMEELTIDLGNLSLGNTDVGGTEEEIRAEYETLKAETDKLLSDHTKEAKAKIDEAYAKLTGGADFTEVLADYTQMTDFTSVEAFKEKGMLMSDNESTTDWPQAVKDAAMKLTALGAYTEVIQDADKFYIVQYVQNETEGDVDYGTVKSAVEAQALLNKQETEWTALVEQWGADTALVTRYPDVLKGITL